MKKWFSLSLVAFAIFVLVSCGAPPDRIKPAGIDTVPCYTIPPFDTSDMMAVCGQYPLPSSTAPVAVSTTTTIAPPSTVTTAVESPVTATSTVITEPRPRPTETFGSTCPPNVDTP